MCVLSNGTQGVKWVCGMGVSVCVCSDKMEHDRKCRTFAASVFPVGRGPPMGVNFVARSIWQANPVSGDRALACRQPVHVADGVCVSRYTHWSRMFDTFDCVPPCQNIRKRKHSLRTPAQNFVCHWESMYSQRPGNLFKGPQKPARTFQKHP